MIRHGEMDFSLRIIPLQVAFPRIQPERNALLNKNLTYDGDHYD